MAIKYFPFNKIKIIQKSIFNDSRFDFSGISRTMFNNKPFSGIIESIDYYFKKIIYINGIWNGLRYKEESSSKVISTGFYDMTNGYRLTVVDGEVKEFEVYDMGNKVESFLYYKNKYHVEYISTGTYQNDTFELWLKESNIDSLINKALIEYGLSELDTESIWNVLNGHPMILKENVDFPAERAFWAYYRKQRMEQGYYENDRDFMPYYYLQTQMKEQVVKEDQLSEHIKYIAGVDVAYNELEQRMVGGIVVLDASTLEVVDKASYEMEITFPYVPGLFSFREILPVVEAFKKLHTKPDLIVCDAQGIAHPKNVGMATHLGIELDIPTIGCAKKRLVGVYEREALGKNRGDFQELNWNNEIVGRALRTQNDTNPMFISICHKISLETACEWVLKLCNQYRLPETTRQADQLVNSILKERTEYNLLED